MIRVRVVASSAWSAALLPVATRTSTGWQFSACVPRCWHDLPEAVVLEMLSDLSAYGLIAGACRIGEGTFVWPGGAQGDGLNGYPCLAPAESACAPGSALWGEPGTAAVADGGVELPPYALLAGARAVAARLRMPFVNTGLLALISLGTQQDAPKMVVPFPRVDEQAFVMQFRPAIRHALAVHRRMVRERRRIALGLGVDVSEAVLDAHIETEFVLPLARHYLQQCMGAAAEQVHLVRSAETGDFTPLVLVVSPFDVSQPIGENVFALTMRRLFYQNPRSTVRRYVDVSPFGLRKRLRRISPAAAGVGQAMLAALQMEFLESSFPGEEERT